MTRVCSFHLQVLRFATWVVILSVFAGLSWDVSVETALVLQHTFRSRKRGPARPKPDPFATHHTDEQFKLKYRFYRDDVRRLARELGLPPIIRTESRHTMPRDRAVLCLLAK
jgi:hypothetical protein